MVKLLDRVKQSVSGTAANTTLGAAATGFRTFNGAGAATNDVCRYAIEDDNGAFEIGTIVINSATTGTRTVETSSNSNNALTLTGNAVIFATLSAADLSGNAVPRWTTTPASSLEFAPGVAATITGVAVDEAGYPIQYSWDGFSGTNIYSPSNLPAQLSTAPTFNTSTKSWTLTPSSSSSDAGSFVFRSRASDGVNTLTANTATSLSFMYTSGLLGWYDADNYTSGSTSWADKSNNSGPSLTVDPSKITYTASGVGSLPIISINGTSAAGTSTSFGTGATVVVVGHGRSRSSVQYFEKVHAQSSSGTLAGRHAIVIGKGYTFAAGGYFGSNTKVFVDKTDVTSYNVGQYSVLYGTTLHTLVVSDLDQSGGYAFAGTGSHYPQWEIRAILIYDHEPSTANVTAIHDYFKSQYASDTDMAP